MIDIEKTEAKLYGISRISEKFHTAEEKDSALPKVIVLKMKNTIQSDQQEH